ncbi:MAG: hypothetical protein ACFUZC_21795 [Chthoniobacteraceae bacterium]
MTPFISTLWYYVDAENHLLGPVSTAALDLFFVEGFISLGTRIIRENGVEYQTYGSIFSDSSLRDSLY